MTRLAVFGSRAGIAGSRPRTLGALLGVFIALPCLVGQAQAELDRPPPGSFTVVVIPDTQGYRGHGTKAQPESTAPVTNDVFENHTRWIVEHREAQNIVFVSHVGDIVDRNTHDEWRVARGCLDRLHGLVPYALTVGNHDMEGDGNASLFQRYFGADRFSDFPWYGGTFEPDRPEQMISGNNVNSFQLFSAGGVDFVHLSLECNAPDDVLAWADGVLTRHASRRALLTTHMDLGIVEKPTTPEGFIHDLKGRMRWSKIHGERGNTAEQMWDKLYRKHANLAFIFSGDQSRVTALRLDRTNDQGTTVVALLSDYTSSGPVRLYRFIPADHQVQVITYDTTRHELVTSTRYVADRDAHQFTVAFDFHPPISRRGAVRR